MSGLCRHDVPLFLHHTRPKLHPRRPVRDTLNDVLQSRLADKEAAESRAAASEADNAELAARLVETKRTEIQRMHETNRICEQMVRR